MCKHPTTLCWRNCSTWHAFWRIVIAFPSTYLRNTVFRWLITFLWTATTPSPSTRTRTVCSVSSVTLSPKCCIRASISPRFALWPSGDSLELRSRQCPSLPDNLDNCTYFISVNRYERKKDVEKAILGFSKLRAKLGPNVYEKKKLRLVICGGYDPRLSENVEYYNELIDLAIVTSFCCYKSRMREFQSMLCS